MRSSKFSDGSFFLSLGTLAAGFSFDGLPSTATTNAQTSGTLIRTNGDATSFSLLLRLVSQNGGDIIQTFQSEQRSSIPFSFTPKDTGSFIIEVISNLQPISATQEPDKIFASSSTFNVAAGSNNQSPPPSSSSSSSDNGSGDTTSSSTESSQAAQQTSKASSIASTTSETTNNGNGQASPTSTSSSAGTPASTTNGLSVTTSSQGTSSTSSGGESAFAGIGVSPAATSSSSGSTNSGATSGGSAALSGSGGPSSSTSPPGSTSTGAPTAAASRVSRTGMIIGIVFGVIAFVVITLSLLLAYTRYRRRQRTSAFEKQLMVRQSGSSPLVFSIVTPPPSTNNNPFRGNTDTETATRSEASRSVYSAQSVYSDSPSIFYTAVPRTMAVPPTPTSASAVIPPAPTGPPPTPPPAVTLPSTAVSSPSTATTPAATAALPQLAPGWVFPRTQATRISHLPPPRTDRQMEIYDRKVRLQGKLITAQGWGASRSPNVEVQALKEEIRKLETLESSDWALGKTDTMPAGLS